MQLVKVNGYEELKASVAELAPGQKQSVFVLFTGSKDASGKSWCPDCVTAEPVVDAARHEVLDDIPDSVFITCYVGDRPFWKDQQNAFRTDADLRLTGVPTLLNWNNKTKRLVEEQLFNKDLIEMLFDDA